MSKQPETNTVIQSLPLEEVIEERFGRYSKYIIQERALPDVRDGLKPVQRRILYSMYKEGNTAEKAYRKSAKTVGNVIGNYHPHGDTSVYDAMVRLSQQWKMRMPLIDMQGNNGSIDDDPAAAMRYTEARLATVAALLIQDMDKDTVLMAPNFDDTEEEPTVLPAAYPNLLVNGATGIAAGYATNIAPHNLAEVIDATVLRMQHPHCDLETIMDVLPGPDFPTGGIVQGRKGIEDAFRTGKGRIVVRSKTEIITLKNGMQQIVVTEIPFDVIKKNIVTKITEIQYSKEIDGIVEVRDESGRDGLRIVVDIKKDMDAQAILNYLFKNTDLQIYYNYNMVGIVNKRPKLLGVLDILDAYIAHREEVVLRRSRYDLERKEKRCHILEGLKNMMSVLDEVIDIIRHSKDKADAKMRLIDRFAFTEPQAEAIVTLRLYRLTNFDIQELNDEFAQLLNEMEALQEIIQDKRILHNTIIRELRAIRAQYPQERLTQIEDEVEELVINKTSMIANERVMLTVSRDGYIKRASMRSYNAVADALPGLKESDHLIGQCEADTLDTVLVFTDQGNYASLPMYQLEENKWKDIGAHVSKYVKMNNAERIVDACIVKDFNTYAWVILVSQNGMIKRTPVSEWQLSRNSKTAMAMNLQTTDRVIRVVVGYAGDDIVLISKQGYMVRYPIHEIPVSSCKSRGVKAMNLTAGDRIACASILDDQASGVIVVTERLQTKRIRASEITTYKRPARGDLAAKKVKTKPNVMRYLVGVHLYDELWFQDEAVHKVLAKDIALMSREATFSAPLPLQTEWFLHHGIPEVKIIDLPPQPESLPSHDDYDMIQLDL